MADEYERQRHEDRVLAAMYRLDPERLAAVRRATTGMTRCPVCDTVNPAAQRKCSRCGANLYYDLPDEEEKKPEESQEEPSTHEKREETKPASDNDKPPYY